MLEKILESNHFIVLIAILSSIVIYKIIIFFIKRSFRFVLKKSDDKRAKTLIGLICNLVKYIVIIVLLLVILETYGVNTKNIIASLGVVGLVIGLAFQDLLKDLIVGFSIVLEGLFKVGDIVTINDFKGEIIELSLKTTKIKAVTGEVKSISNRNISEIVNHSIENAGTALDILLSYEEDLIKIDKLSEKILTRVNKEITTLTEPMQYLGISELADSGLKVKFFFKTKYQDKFSTDREIRRIVLEELKTSKIDIPYNHLTIING